MSATVCEYWDDEANDGCGRPVRYIFTQVCHDGSLMDDYACEVCIPFIRAGERVLTAIRSLPRPLGASCEAPDTNEKSSDDDE